LINLLCISNGHGEDVIALRILTALRQQQPSIQLSALPISGTGSAYRNADIDIIGPTKNLPSGGFLNRDPKQLARDVSGGLISLTRDQLAAIKAWKTRNVGQNPHVLAVGDIVPLIFAHRNGQPYHFIGTAKSEYWLRDEQGKHPSKSILNRLEGWAGSVYLPWERWLMSRSQCRSVFVRDALTAQQLQSLGVNAIYAGNPMMDSLAPTGQLADDLSGADLVIALIPGSRPPEAYENWARIMAAVPSVVEAFSGQQIVFLGAIAPSLDLTKFKTTLPSQNARLILTNAYNDCLAKSDIAIATAGTATEQFVGLGKPAITLPGNGPQFTQAFATVQAKMLGPSVVMVQKQDEVGSAIAQIINNPTRLQQIRQNGKQRMGDPGAGQRIAHQLLQAMT